MHLLFVLFDFTIVFCFAWGDYVASFCNSPFFVVSAANIRWSGTVLDSKRATLRSRVSNQPSGLLLSPRFLDL
mgnify:CR=1 FL=1